MNESSVLRRQFSEWQIDGSLNRMKSIQCDYTYMLIGAKLFPINQNHSVFVWFEIGKHY